MNIKKILLQLFLILIIPFVIGQNEDLTKLITLNFDQDSYFTDEEYTVTLRDSSQNKDPTKN